MDDSAAGLLKEAVSFRVSLNETPGTFGLNIKLEDCGKEIVATGITRLFYNDRSIIIYLQIEYISILLKYLIAHYIL